MNRTALKIAGIALIVLSSACTSIGTVRTYNDFMVVTAEPGDSFANLADKYYGTSNMADVIADFNQTEHIQVGQELIIPKRPLFPGGMMAKGYQTIPVLVYHRIEENSSSNMVVTKKNFRAQMQYLKDNDYRVLSLDQLLDFMEFKGSVPKKSVVITFDDGWQSLYKNGFPILQEFGFPATLFVYTDLIEGSQKALSWEQIRNMSDNGMSIQCHTRTHRNLTQLMPGENFEKYFQNIESDILKSRDKIQKKINKTVNYIAYPYGAVNNLLVALLEKNGFRAAFTVKRGSSWGFMNHYYINRSMIFGEYNLEQFKKNLHVVKAR